MCTKPPSNRLSFVQILRTKANQRPIFSYFQRNHCFSINCKTISKLLKTDIHVTILNLNFNSKPFNTMHIVFVHASLFEKKNFAVTLSHQRLLINSVGLRLRWYWTVIVTWNHVIHALPEDLGTLTRIGPATQKGSPSTAVTINKYRHFRSLPGRHLCGLKNGLMEKEVIRSLGNKNLAASIDWYRELLLFQMLL